MTQKQLLELLAKRVRYWVFRGGGWNGDARLCRSAYRYYSTPAYRGYDLGFRLALIRRNHDAKATT